MAQKVTVTLEDDLDGGEAQETIQFALNGQAYEIDLNKKNADKLRKTVGPYIEHGRRVALGRSSSRKRGAASRHRSQEIRDWAKSAGLKVSDRGRIPEALFRQYEDAH